jgi:hypothetical protein
MFAFILAFRIKGKFIEALVKSGLEAELLILNKI